MSITKTPEAYIALNKSRVKIFPANNNNKVYLQSGQEFQIELFNPSSKTVLAMISLNGVESISGMVLKPGQRYFLDRFVDENKKLKFDTYEIENSSEAKAATAQNGLVTVKFYNEKQYYPPIFINPAPITYTYTYNTILPYSPLRGSSGTDNLNTNINSTKSTFVLNSLSNALDGNHTTVSYSSVSNSNPVVLDSLNLSDYKQTSQQTKSLETGRVEKGDKSAQKFKIVNMDFETWTCATVSYTLTPISQKPVEVAELVKKFCSSCGAKVKGSHKFCATCGNKLD